MLFSLLSCYWLCVPPRRSDDADGATAEKQISPLMRGPTHHHSSPALLLALLLHIMHLQHLQDVVVFC
jgi:hypothetical protein